MIQSPPLSPPLARPSACLPPAPPAPRLATAARKALGLGAVLALGACAQLNPSAPPRLDETGAVVKGVYMVTYDNVARVRERAVQTVNARRAAAGLAPVTLDPALVVAADNHSRSMSEQGRAWNFGVDGSSPYDRARRAGFAGEVLGELVSETYESEVQAVAAWAEIPAQRALMMNPAARRLGVGVYQDADNKLWWTLVIGN